MKTLGNAGLPAGSQQAEMADPKQCCAREAYHEFGLTNEYPLVMFGLTVFVTRISGTSTKTSSDERVPKDEDTQCGGSDEIKGGYNPSNPLK